MAEWAFEKQGWKTAYVLLDTTIAFDATWCGTFKRRWAELAGAEGLLGEDTFGGEDPQIASQITRHQGVWPSSRTSSRSAPSRPAASAPCASCGRPASTTPTHGLGILGRRLLARGRAQPDRHVLRHLCVSSSATTRVRRVAEFMEKFEAKIGGRAVTSHAVTGYSVIEAWSKAVTEAGSLRGRQGAGEARSFQQRTAARRADLLHEGPHINMQRDLVLIEVDGGKSGNVVGVIAARADAEVGHSNSSCERRGFKSFRRSLLFQLPKSDHPTCSKPSTFRSPSRASRPCSMLRFASSPAASSV